MNPPPDTLGSTPGAVSFGEAVRVWLRVALLSFGGPAAQISVMHRILVDEKKWLSEERFLHALNYCMLLPGPEAQQLATYVGWLLHRLPGGLTAGILFILPGFASMLGLSLAYWAYQHTFAAQSLLGGLQAAVLAIVVQAVMRISRRVLRNPALVAIAAVACALLAFGDAPFPAVIVAAGAAGMLGGKWAPQWFAGGRGAARGADDRLPADAPPPSLAANLRLVGTFVALWCAPAAALGLACGWRSVYVEQALFFGKAAVVTFGGAYAVLAYLAQEAVHRYGWLQPGEMLDGLGMAESTPGPLIQVVQFVGFLGAARDPGPLSPLAAGIAGSLIATWVTFVPSFLWVFLGAPYMERLRAARLLNTALTAISAAVAGGMVHVALWFAVHVLLDAPPAGGAARLDIPACLTTLLALVLAFPLRRGLGATLGVATAAGTALQWAFSS